MQKRYRDLSVKDLLPSLSARTENHGSGKESKTRAASVLIEKLVWNPEEQQNICETCRSMRIAPGSNARRYKNQIAGATMGN